MMAAGLVPSGMAPVEAMDPGLQEMVKTVRHVALHPVRARAGMSVDLPVRDYREVGLYPVQGSRGRVEEEGYSWKRLLDAV